jgi:predicted HicB family RNase H-like nuclease
MADPKPFASLSPTLLARKGGAKPAMRSQASAVMVSHEDLGWNDMGHGQVLHEAEIVSINADVRSQTGIPEVVRQQQAIARQIGAERRSALANGRRAAFTLRVDAERHLKLRLACTVKGCSAQQLVTQALDQLLDGLPEIADLAAQVAKHRP